jgi:hypothetical protein
MCHGHGAHIQLALRRPPSTAQKVGHRRLREPARPPPRASSDRAEGRPRGVSVRQPRRVPESPSTPARRPPDSALPRMHRPPGSALFLSGETTRGDDYALVASIRHRQSYSGACRPSQSAFGLPPAGGRILQERRSRGSREICVEPWPVERVRGGPRSRVKPRSGSRRTWRHATLAPPFSPTWNLFSLLCGLL